MLRKFQQKVTDSDIGWIIENMDLLNIPFEDGFTALQHAILLDNFQAASHLIHQAGYQTEDGYTALIFATWADNVKIIPLLLQKEVCMQDNDGKTALMHAVAKQALKSVEILVKYEANMTDKHGCIAISYCDDGDLTEFLQQFEVLRPNHEEFLQEFE